MVFYNKSSVTTNQISKQFLSVKSPLIGLSAYDLHIEKFAYSL